MRCAEIRVRFASTLVQVVHVAPGARCRAGRTRDADIALDVPTFTVVAATPHGFVVDRGDGAPLALDAPVELSFGEVVLAIALVAVPRAPLARRRIERRPLAFGAGSLAVHAGLVLAALATATPGDDRVPGATTAARRPTQIARFAVAAQTLKRTATPAPTTTPITTDDTPSPTPALEERAAAVPRSATARRPDGRGPITIARSPVVVPSDGDGEAASSRRRFDPSTDPAFDSVKVGNFTTVATGAAGGEHYELAGANGKRRPLIVISCDAASCLVIGGDAAQGVRQALEQRLPDIVGCYEAHAQAAGKKVELDFGIDDAGKVERVDVGGVGDYDACVARIIQSLDFDG